MKQGLRNMKIKPPRPHVVPRQKNLHSTYSWHTGMADDKILRVSKSSLGTFQFCEQQYFIKYVLGVKEPENDAMIRGTNVHDAYEYILDTQLDIHHAHALRDNEGYSSVHKYFQSLIPKSQVKKGWEDKVAKYTGNEYNLDEDIHLSKLMTAEANRFMKSDPTWFLPSANERTIDAVVELDINGKKVLVHLTGIVDRLFQDAEGNVHVHELKSGKWKDTATKYEGMAKEMAFYVYLMRKSDDPEFGNLRVTHWGWDHTAGHLTDTKFEGTIYRFVEPVRVKLVSEMLADLKALASAHLRYKDDFNGKSFAVKDSGAERYICEPWCAVKGFCPKYERATMPYEMKQKAEGN